MSNRLHFFFFYIEHERAALQEQVHHLHNSLETMLKEMEESRKNLEKELRSTQTLLDKESAKNHSVQRQHEVCHSMTTMINIIKLKSSTR